jgi:hypothetical protein
MQNLINNTSSFCLKKLSSHRFLTLVFIAGGLILTNLACNTLVGKANSNSNRGSGPTDFTKEDCNIPWLPPPVAAEEDIFPTHIYCVYHAGGKLHGLVYLSLNYYQKAEDAKKGFDGWHKNLEDYYKNYDIVYNTPDELFKMLVTPTEIGQYPDNDFARVVLFRDHFVILIKGGVSNTSESEATGMVHDLVSYAMGIADEHYPEN